LVERHNRRAVLVRFGDEGPRGADLRRRRTGIWLRRKGGRGPDRQRGDGSGEEPARTTHGGAPFAKPPGFCGRFGIYGSIGASQLYVLFRRIRDEGLFRLCRQPGRRDMSFRSGKLGKSNCPKPSTERSFGDAPRPTAPPSFVRRRLDGTRGLKPRLDHTPRCPRTLPVVGGPRTGSPGEGRSPRIRPRMPHCTRDVSARRPRRGPPLISRNLTGFVSTSEGLDRGNRTLSPLT
jgi:hypothetical protein